MDRYIRMDQQIARHTSRQRGRRMRRSMMYAYMYVCVACMSCKCRAMHTCIEDVCMHSASRVCSRLHTVTLSSVLTPHFAVHTHTFDKGSYLPLSLRRFLSKVGKLPATRFTSRPEARESGVEAVFRFLGSGVDFF